MAAGVIAAAAALGAKQKAQREAAPQSHAVFAELAARRKLVLETVEHRTPLGPLALPRVSGVVAGMAVAIEISLDAASLAHTRALADARVPADVEVALAPTPPGLFGALRSLFDARDITLGDTRFDELFVVHGSPPEAAITLLDEARRATFVSWLGHHFEGFRYTRGRITLGWEGVEHESLALESSLALLDDVASWRFAHQDGGYRG